MLRQILLFNLEFSILFIITYLLAVLMIRFVLKRTTFNVKYFILKAVPSICVFVLAIDFLVRKVTKNVVSNDVGALGEFNEIASKNLNHLGNWRTCLHYFTILWVVGFAVLGVKYMGDYFLFRRRILKRNKICTSSLLNESLDECRKILKITGKIDIHYSDFVKTPITFDAFHPQILIPKGMRENLETIILHEAVHCMRHDMLVKTCIELLKIMQWLNPIIYLYASRLNQYCEYACDERVAAQMSFEEKKEYAGIILNSARKQRYPIFLKAFSDSGNLKQRLSYLLYPGERIQKQRNLLLSVGIIFMIGVGILVLRNPHVGNILYIPQNNNEEAQIKTIKKNYLKGQEVNEYDYEEYIDGFWWRGTLLKLEDRMITDGLTEVTFSGEIYKCEG